LDVNSVSVAKNLRPDNWLASARDLLFRWRRWLIVILGLGFLLLELIEHLLDFRNLEWFILDPGDALTCAHAEGAGAAVFVAKSMPAETLLTTIRQVIH
jgi:hypothetical protein